MQSLSNLQIENVERRDVRSPVANRRDRERERDKAMEEEGEAV